MRSILDRFLDQLDSASIRYKAEFSDQPPTLTLLILPWDRPRIQRFLVSFLKENQITVVYQNYSGKRLTSCLPRWSFHGLRLSFQDGVFVHLDSARFWMGIPLVSSQEIFQVPIHIRDKLLLFWGGLYTCWQHLISPKGLFVAIPKRQYADTLSSWIAWLAHHQRKGLLPPSMVGTPFFLGWVLFKAFWIYLRGGIVIYPAFFETQRSSSKSAVFKKWLSRQRLLS